MQNLKMYCICIHNELLSKVKRLNYIPVGLGGNKFDTGWVTDNSGENISKKNRFYGEHSFHYWFWKNEINNISENDWVGFWLIEDLSMIRIQEHKIRIFKIEY